MTITASNRVPAAQPDRDSYTAGHAAGYTDHHLPQHLTDARASMAQPHDPYWAAGYLDGITARLMDAIGNGADHLTQTIAARLGIVL